MQGVPRYAYFLAFTLGAGGYAFVSPQVNTYFAAGLSLTLALLFTAIVFARTARKASGFGRRFGQGLDRGVWLLLAFSSGAAINHFHLNSRIDQQLPQRFEQLDLTVDAQIIGLARDNGQAWVFDAWIDNIRLTEAGAQTEVHAGLKALSAIKGKVRLSWYKTQIERAQLSVGQAWQLQLRLRRPRGLVNPGVFDYQAWLLARAYIATGYVRGYAAASAHAHNSGPGFNIWIHRLRQHIQQNLFAAIAEPSAIETAESPLKGLAFAKIQQALLLGDKSGLTAADWSLLQSTGTVHLMAISGLHVGLVAALAFFLGRGLVRVLPGSGLLLLLPALSSVAAASFYAAIAGFSIPTQRALLLVLLFNLAYCFGKRLNPFDVLATAAALVVVFDPFAFLTPGFWLSFSAVWVLIYSFGLQRAPVGKWRSALWSQWVVGVGLLVPLAALGLPASVSAPLANLIAIPVISLLVVPGLFMALALSIVSLHAASWVLQGCDQLLNLLWVYLEFLRQLPVANVWLAVGQPLVVLVLAGGLGGALLLAPHGLGLRILGLALLLLGLAPTHSQQAGLALTVLDVGQGLAVVLRHQHYTVVYDTGDQFSPSFDVGSRIIAPFLRGKGANRVNLLIVSHGDKDHAGGVRGLSQSVAINERVYGPDLKQRALAEGGVPLCQAGMHWRFGELSLSAIHPDAAFSESAVEDNDLSCTILLEYQGFRALLPGDIEKAAEYYLLAKDQLRPVDVLVAPHHGSQSSSSLSLLAKTQPKLAVFSAGYRNRYGHPSQKIVERYQNLAVEILNTAREGAITVKVAPNGSWQVQRQREEALRLWFDTP